MGQNRMEPTGFPDPEDPNDVLARDLWQQEMDEDKYGEDRWRRQLAYFFGFIALIMFVYLFWQVRPGLS